MKIQGSSFIALAETKEEIMKLLKDDVYATSDVWDLENVCLTSSGLSLGYTWDEILTLTVAANISFQGCFQEGAVGVGIATVGASIMETKLLRVVGPWMPTM